MSSTRERIRSVPVLGPCLAFALELFRLEKTRRDLSRDIARLNVDLIQHIARLESLQNAQDVRRDVQDSRLELLFGMTESARFSSEHRLGALTARLDEVRLRVDSLNLKTEDVWSSLHSQHSRIAGDHEKLLGDIHLLKNHLSVLLDQVSVATSATHSFQSQVTALEARMDQFPAGLRAARRSDKETLQLIDSLRSDVSEIRHVALQKPAHQLPRGSEMQIADRQIEGIRTELIGHLEQKVSAAVASIPSQPDPPSPDVIERLRAELIQQLRPTIDEGMRALRTEFAAQMRELRVQIDSPALVQALRAEVGSQVALEMRSQAGLTAEQVDRVRARVAETERRIAELEDALRHPAELPGVTRSGVNGA